MILIKKNYAYFEILVTFFLNVDMYIGFICIIFNKGKMKSLLSFCIRQCCNVLNIACHRELYEGFSVFGS